MPSSVSPKIKIFLLSLALFGLLAICLTWPLALNLNSKLPAGTDSIVHYWNSWWVQQAITSDQSPYQTSAIFFPDGVSLVYHNFALVHIATALAFDQFLPTLASYNLVLLLNLALCGVTMTYLAYELTRDKPAAFLAGLIYIAWPYRLTQPDHPNLHSTWPIPLFMLALYRLLTKKRGQDALGCGLAFALVGYMRWQLLIPATVIGIVFVLIYWWHAYRHNEEVFSAAQLRGLVLAAGLALLCLAPPIWLLAQEWQNNPAQLVPTGEELTMQTDLLAYVTPAPWHSVIGRLTTPLYENYYPDRGSRAIFSPFLGFIPLILIIIALRQFPRRQTIPWLLVGITLILLALGPTLRFNGTQYESVPTLYSLLNRLYILRLLREPDRFNMFTALPTAVLAAYGAKHLLQRIAQHRFARFAPLLLGLLILAEFSVVPLPLQATAVSPFYETLSTEPAGALIDIPLDPFKAKPYMLAQISHGRPIIQGHVSRYPDGAFHFLETDPWLNETLLFDGQPPVLADTGAKLAQLASAGFSHLVLHKTDIDPLYLQKWRRTIPLQPTFEDEEILVFHINPFDPALFSWQAEVDSSLGALQITPSATCLNPAGVFGIDVVWGLLTPSTIDLSQTDVIIDLQNNTESITSEPIPFTGINPYTAGLPTFFAADYEWDLPDTLATGTYTAKLILRDRPSAQEIAQLTAVDPITVQETTCQFSPPSGSTLTNARFGDAARLLGYDLNQTAQELNLTLFWRAEQRTGVDYTIFVHLFDPATGLPVAQSDHMPRQWTYPTSRWGLNETIPDETTLDITHLPSGPYHIGVGLYNSVTGERVPITQADGTPVIDQRLLLQPINID